MHVMLPIFMQCLLFALIRLVTSYLKSPFYLKQFLFSLSIISHVKSAWSIRIPIGLSVYLYPSWACPPLCGLGAWDFLSMAIKN